MYKKNTENYKFYIASSVIVILLLWIWMQKSTINSLKVLNSEMTHEISADGRYMATQRQNIMDLESALKSGLLEKERYMKNVKSQTKIVTKTLVQEKLVAYHDTVEVFFDTLDKRYWVKTPAPVRYSDSFNLISGKVTKNGFQLDTLETLNEFRVSIFDKKQGLFKKSVPVVEIKSNNPNTKVDKIKNITIERKTPFFTKWWFIGSVGILLGHFLI